MLTCIQCFCIYDHLCRFLAYIDYNLKLWILFSLSIIFTYFQHICVYGCVYVYICAHTHTHTYYRPMQKIFNKKNHMKRLSKKVVSKIIFLSSRGSTETLKVGWKCRNRKIIWFNPRLCKLSTIRQYFLKLITKHFHKNNPLNEIFNRKMIKISSSCTNMYQIINSHNNHILNKFYRKKLNPARNPHCNRMNRENRPVEDKCRSTSYIPSNHHPWRK